MSQYVCVCHLDACECLCSKEPLSLYHRFHISPGRFDVLIQKTRCRNCDYTHDSLDLECVIKNGYWPGSVINISTIYDCKLLKFWSVLHTAQPRCSESGFLRVLCDISKSNARVRSFTALPCGPWHYLKFIRLKIQILHRF